MITKLQELLNADLEPFDVGTSVKKIDVKTDAILSAIAEVLAKQNNVLVSSVRKEPEKLVTAQMAGYEPEQ